MSKSELLHLEHILDAICAIEEFTKNFNANNFHDQRMRYDAVLRNLQTLSESTQKLSDSTKSNYPEIPWHNITGFRNIIVHDYLGGIDHEIVWSIIESELPKLKTAINQVIQSKD